jgi:hypothetical protein
VQCVLDAGGDTLRYQPIGYWAYYPSKVFPHRSGRLAAPNSERTDGPVATLPRDRDAVRGFKEGDLKSSVTVMVRGGKYFLDDPFVLDSHDSGDHDHKITYQAYPDTRQIDPGERINSLAQWQKWATMNTPCLPILFSWMRLMMTIRLKADSPAKQPGFEPIDPTSFGPAKVTKHKAA